ncbi:carbohydrate porin [Bradyrhizobium centrosematis]|uniref:carbohydrate porin n=1 Tax=Bradyrhizobium centrosematis TaxID=1300039 RepID=UPI00216791F3|nr:carbohydrate porin [Bradyrhizobium centrosematis]MCS3764763.1 porin [Bradyrhizobium centrosematis]MCS3776185.1 porin [Bradyrhizobium centrosematis]
MRVELSEFDIRYLPVQSLSSVPQMTKHKGLLVAVSVAASLVSGTALAQTTSAPSSNAAASDLAVKKKTGKKASVRSNKLPRKDGNFSALAAPAHGLSRTGSLGPVARSTSAKVDPFAKFENLREKGLEITIPGPADTVVQDAGGVRSALADLGIGFVGWSQATYTNNQLPNAAKSTIANQLYSGQIPTFSTNNYFYMTYDLSRYGIPDGQIVLGADEQYYTWKPGGPDRVGLATMSYYQTFWDRRFEFKIGYLRQNNEFAGQTVGGNAAANVFGPSSNMLYQGGISNAAAPTPAINLKFNIDDHWYTKATVQQSMSPDGYFTQVTQNPTALTLWRTPNSGILFLDETGYLSKAAPGSPDTWFRAGAGYNTSKYNNLEFPTLPRSEGNTVYYVATDRQLWQTNAEAPSRGIYGGFTVMYAPPDLNKVTQYQELRLYAKGLFDSRPNDQISLVVTDLYWSAYAVEAALAKKNLVHWDSKAISGTYTARLAPGIYLNLGVSYINNPTTITYTPQIGHALNFSASTSIFF